MKIHFVKQWPEYHERTLKGLKPWEIRLNDRSFEPGDQVVQEEWNPTTQAYTGSWVQGTITFLMVGVMGLKDDYCCFTFSPILSGTDGLPPELALEKMRQAEQAAAA